MLLLTLMVVLIVTVFLLFKFKQGNNNEKKNDDECLEEGKDEDLISPNIPQLLYNKLKQQNTKLFFLPSLFTDHRIFTYQKEILKEQLHIFQLKQLNNIIIDNYTIDNHTVDKNNYKNKKELTLKSYAKHFITILKEESKNVNEFYLGGFCVGGMISILIGQLLQKKENENLFKKCKGILIIGSCPSFTKCVKEKYLILKKIFLTILPKSILFYLIKLYLWTNKQTFLQQQHTLQQQNTQQSTLQQNTQTLQQNTTKNTILNKFFSLFEYLFISLSQGDLNILKTYEKELISMMIDKDPNFVTEMLIAEFNFTGNCNELNWNEFKLPIYHLHGDHDYLIPINKCEDYVNYFILKRNNLQQNNTLQKDVKNLENNLQQNEKYNLKRLEKSGHFLTLTRRNAVLNWMYNILN
ncbi:hypothetical protein ABK040_001339 [Willaertia magna]